MNTCKFGVILLALSCCLMLIVLSGCPPTEQPPDDDADEGEGEISGGGGGGSATEGETGTDENPGGDAGGGDVPRGRSDWTASQEKWFFSIEDACAAKAMRQEYSTFSWRTNPHHRDQLPKYEGEYGFEGEGEGEGEDYGEGEAEGEGEDYGEGEIEPEGEVEMGDCYRQQSYLLIEGGRARIIHEKVFYNRFMRKTGSETTTHIGTVSRRSSRIPREIDLEFTRVFFSRDMDGVQTEDVWDDYLSYTGIYKMDNGNFVMSANEYGERPSSFEEPSDWWVRMLSPAQAAGRSSWGPEDYGMPNPCVAGFWYDAYGLEVEFISSSWVNGGDIIAYHWDFGDGEWSYNHEPWHIYQSPGTYQVCLTIYSDLECESVSCQTIYVDDDEEYEDYCQASFYWEGNGAQVYFHDDSWSDYGSIVEYYWTFGDGTSSYAASPVHLYSSPGSYGVCLTIQTSTGCVDQQCYTVNVSSSAEGEDTGSCGADFFWDTYASEVNFYSQSWSDYGSIVEYHWTFGDGSSSYAVSPVHLYSSPGSYGVCLIIQTSTGCVDQQCYTVNVFSSGEGEEDCPPVNDTCASAIAIQFNDSIAGNNCCATTSVATAPGHKDVWYRWTASFSGSVSADTCVYYGFDTRLAVYSSCGGSPIAENDDYCGVGSKIFFSVQSGMTYYIRVSSFGSSNCGSFTLTLSDGGSSYEGEGECCSYCWEECCWEEEMCESSYCWYETYCDEYCWEECDSSCYSCK